MKDFLASQGYGARNLDKVTFYEGDGGRWQAQFAFGRNNPAITLNNNIYVRGDLWSRKSTPRYGDPTFFEEIIHTVQWDLSGTIDFGLTYLRNAVAAGVLANNMHDGPAEIQAMGLSRKLMQAYKDSGKKCSD